MDKTTMKRANIARTDKLKMIPYYSFFTIKLFPNNNCLPCPRAGSWWLVKANKAILFLKCQFLQEWNNTVTLTQTLLYKKLSYRKDRDRGLALRRSRSFEVTYFGTNRKPIWNFY